MSLSKQDLPVKTEQRKSNLVRCPFLIIQLSHNRRNSDKGLPFSVFQRPSSSHETVGGVSIHTKGTHP